MRGGGRLHAPVDPELAQDVRHVDARGARADEQLGADLAVRASLAEQREDRPLALGQQRLQRGGGRRRRRRGGAAPGRRGRPRSPARAERSPPTSRASASAAAPRRLRSARSAAAWSARSAAGSGVPSASRSALAAPSSSAAPRGSTAASRPPAISSSTLATRQRSPSASCRRRLSRRRSAARRRVVASAVDDRQLVQRPRDALGEAGAARERQRLLEALGGGAQVAAVQRGGPGAHERAGRRRARGRRAAGPTGPPRPASRRARGRPPARRRTRGSPATPPRPRVAQLAPHREALLVQAAGVGVARLLARDRAQALEHRGDAAAVAELVVERERRDQARRRRRVVALQEREHAGAGQDPHPHRGGHAIGQGGGLLEPHARLGVVPAAVPERPQQAREAAAVLGGDRQQPPQRRAQVVVLELHAVQPGHLVGLALGGQRQEERRVRLEGAIALARLAQLVRRVPANRLQQAVAGVARAAGDVHQRAVDEPPEDVEHVARVEVVPGRDGLAGGQRERAAEGREPPEHRLLVRVEHAGGSSRASP